MYTFLYYLIFILKCKIKLEKFKLIHKNYWSTLNLFFIFHFFHFFWNSKELIYEDDLWKYIGFLLVQRNYFLATWTTYNDVCPAYH